ncbi:tripartite tricarboxylate transporter TctB family protein [Arenibaculum sp.]|uniref:tripartite tricarboxylate transporter TctB family protein n=1 Tax=Arenibaculum sp. TaxID=2865862 RepID=UPI002E10ACB2|nr:tripartite tricarboxylate transporter TctB family protein [Arenibaculum sp.]
MTRRTINRTDTIAGLLVASLGIAAFVESLRMPRFEARGVDPYTVPGLTPGILSAVVAVLGVALLLRALLGREGGAGAKPTITVWNRASAMRTVFTVVLVLVYGLVLFGRLPFVPATAIFVFAFTVGAEAINPERRLSIPAVLAGGLVLALASAYAIQFIFTDIFLVRLPG